MSKKKNTQLENITLLGNQNTKYSFDYSQKYSRFSKINIQTVIILLNLIVLNSQAYVQLLDSRILRRFISAIFLIKKW